MPSSVARRVAADVLSKKPKSLELAVAEALDEHRRFYVRADVPQRVAAWLLGSAESDQDAGELRLRLTQGALADEIGASRSYVSTLLNEWKERGLVASYGRVLALRKPSTLERIAQGRAA